METSRHPHWVFPSFPDRENRLSSRVISSYSMKMSGFHYREARNNALFKPWRKHRKDFPSIPISGAANVIQRTKKNRPKLKEALFNSKKRQITVLFAVGRFIGRGMVNRDIVTSADMGRASNRVHRSDDLDIRTSTYESTDRCRYHY